MKAIRKEDSEEINVILLHPKEYIATEPDEFGGRRIYDAEGLVINEPIDWDLFRREVARSALQGMLAHSRNGHGYHPRNPECRDWHQAIAEEAVKLADALIKELMQTKETTPMPKAEKIKMSSDEDFKVGDKVLITCKQQRCANYIYNGKVGEVTHIWDLERNPWGNIGVMLPNGCSNGFLAEELEVVNS